MSFGWSAGDIAAGLKLVSQVSEALSSAQGSTKDHQQAMLFCQSFQSALSAVKSFQIAATNAELESIIDNGTIRALEESQVTMKNLYDDLRHRIDRYACLQAKENEDSMGYLTRQVQKVKWEFFAKEEIQGLREKIVQQTCLLQPSLHLSVEPPI